MSELLQISVFNLEMDRPQHMCFNVMNVCLKDKSCKKLMGYMERDCEAVTKWNQCMRKPVCSEKCRSAVANFFNHKIGRQWREGDCRMPRGDSSFASLSRNENFERNCRRSQNNMRTFCFYDTTCRGKYTQHGYIATQYTTFV